MPSSPLRHVVHRRFPALTHRNFRIYWGCQFTSLIGTWMQSVAQSWLVHRLDPRPIMLGYLNALQFLPVLLFSLWAGVLADRADKRVMLLGTQGTALLQAVAIAIVVTLGIVQPWMVLVLAFVYGVFNAFDLPARQSFLAELVDREHLPNAIALNSAAFNSARVVGPSIAGVLVAALPRLIRSAGIASWFHTDLIGEAGCFWLNALSYVAMLVGLSIMTPVTLGRKPTEGTLHNLRDGIRYALTTRPIRNLLLLLGATTSLGFQYTTLLPLFAKEILHGGADAYGLLVSSFGVGSLAAVVILTRKPDRWLLRRNLFVGLLSAGLGLAVFAWSRWLWLSAAMGLVVGFGLILYVASTNTLLQLTTEDHYRGRVMSLYTFMFIGMAPIGALIAGGIAQAAGAPVSTSFSAAVLLAGAVWMSYRLRVLAAREAAQVTVPADEGRVG